MALDFPANPVDGQIYGSYMWSASTGAWKGIPANASNSFETIATPSGTSPVADNSADTLTLLAGSGITITGDATADSITIAASAPTGVVSQTNGTVTTASTSAGVVRNIYTSTSNPSGGIDGDVWLVYS